MRLKDKVCIITESAKGIGRAVALKFASEGARVVVCDIDSPAIEDTLSKIREKGGNVLGCRVDFTKEIEIQDLIEYVLEKYGRIDVLVNNAGLLQDNLMDKMTKVYINKLNDTNLKATLLCTKLVIEVMKAQKGGAILNVSPAKELYNYFYLRDSFGDDVISLTKNWAKEFGPHGIRSNAVMIGFVDNDVWIGMTDRFINDITRKGSLGRLERPERPEEIANVYAFLVSDEASYINGSVIEISGGVAVLRPELATSNLLLG